MTTIEKTEDAENAEVPQRNDTEKLQEVIGKIVDKIKDIIESSGGTVSIKSCDDIIREAGEAISDASGIANVIPKPVENALWNIKHKIKQNTTLAIMTRAEEEKLKKPKLRVKSAKVTAEPGTNRKTYSDIVYTEESLRKLAKWKKRSEAGRQKAAAFGADLNNYRRVSIRNNSRANLLVYGFIRGKAYADIETPKRNSNRGHFSRAMKREIMDTLLLAHEDRGPANAFALMGKFIKWILA